MSDNSKWVMEIEKHLKDKGLDLILSSIKSTDVLGYIEIELVHSNMSSAKDLLNKVGLIAEILEKHKFITYSIDLKPTTVRFKIIE